ncbi:competence protein ComK [Peribacillus huizhouensis]|uniref:Competence transcription factor ComK n=1 Tax=Peribacillus huizhouensis TaxID=1501239 RepID=A0ABR6CM85_9BACI|nr:competence protein ComK [Peribacillus huizhouensis]MBA9026146.1 competence transcription factor ComK [Peribacillus huizhouensis]
MLLKQFYIINKKTVCLFSEYDEQGNEHTRVIEGKRFIFVKKPIQDVLEESFNYYARNLAGAIVGARSILGDKYFLPVELNVHQGIILAPFHLSNSKKKIWVVTPKIIRPEVISIKETILHLTYGHSISIHLTSEQIEKRRGRAAQLQTTLQERDTIEKSRTILFEPGSGFTVVEEKGEYNFQVKKKKKEE